MRSNIIKSAAQFKNASEKKTYSINALITFLKMRTKETCQMEFCGR